MNNETNTNNTMSKRIFFPGETVNWIALNVRAINVKSGNIEYQTNIPSDKVLSVTFVDGFDPSKPWLVNVTTDRQALAYRKANHGRNFLLIFNGGCVGWATFHRAERDYNVAVATTLTAVIPIKAKSAAEAEWKAKTALENAVATATESSSIRYELDDTCADATLLSE